MSNILLFLTILVTVYTGVLIILKLIRSKTIEWTNILVFSIGVTSLIARYLIL